MQVKCRMRCKGVSTYKGRYNNKDVISGIVKLEAVWSNDPESDSKKYCDATPAGSLELIIDNPEARVQFIPGKDYYVILEPAPDE